MKNWIVIILLVLIVSILLYSFAIPKYKDNQEQKQFENDLIKRNRKSLRFDMNNLASSALAFYKSPTTHGGGGDSWSENVDNVGEWLGYNYSPYNNSIELNGNIYSLSIVNDSLKVVGTGYTIGKDSVNPVKVETNINGMSFHFDFIEIN
jgi:hypothetical protein